MGNYQVWVEHCKQDFLAGGGKGKHWPVALSQTLLCVVEMRLFFMKCINEKTKRLSSERMMLCIDVVYESLCIQHTQIAL